MIVDVVVAAVAPDPAPISICLGLLEAGGSTVATATTDGFGDFESEGLPKGAAYTVKTAAAGYPAAFAWRRLSASGIPRELQAISYNEQRSINCPGPPGG
jgi:hypothetical protein